MSTIRATILILFFLLLAVVPSQRTSAAVPNIEYDSTDNGPYEPNDTCEEAQSIVVDGGFQEHNFQTEGDVDWVKFDATAGTTYRISGIVPSGSRADLAMDIQSLCDNIISQWSSFNPDLRLDFTAPSNGIVYLKIFGDDNNIHGEDVTYQLSVQTFLPSNRALIIVAGRLKADDRLQSNIHNVTNRVYDAAKDNGYNDDDIYYIATDETLAVGYDAAATEDNLQGAITEWAGQRLRAGGTLGLYLMDHGDTDLFYLDEVSEQRLTSTQLDTWLTEFESQIDNVSINVVIETVKAGSFISIDGGSISNLGRVVVASASDTTNAYASQTGAHFSDNFILAIQQGQDIAASFENARSAVEEITVIFPQQPWIDANGNGVHNEDEDTTIASQRYFFSSAQLAPTHTPIPTSTPSFTPTSPPTWTPTHTPTPIPTWTLTPRPTWTSTNTPRPAPTWTPSHTPTPPPTETPPSQSDVNNRCNQATTVLADGAFHEGVFETPADLDWFVFDGVANTPYLIGVEIPSGSPADVNLELYPACDAGPTENWIRTFAPGVQLDFKPSTTGKVYMRLANDDVNAAGDHMRYTLSVRQPNQETGPGAVIIVAGRLSLNDDLQDNIHAMTDEVFAMFQEQGYSNDDIYYLATDTKVLDYDASATVSNLGWAITNWAVERVKLDDVPDVLTLYMMDHGDIDVLYLDEPLGERLTPNQLDGWLDELETTVPGIKINVIIEACHSGSFIREPNSISGEGRMIITSSNEENLARASRGGAYFSDHFLTALREGDNLLGGWSKARDVVEDLFVIFPQDPWMDGNGNGIHNELADFVEASRRGFAYAGTLGPGDRKLWPPYIAQATEPASLDGNSGLITAEVRDDRGVDDVWAVIYPPSYRPPTSGTALIDEDLDMILLDHKGDDIYRGRYSNFTEDGIYRIVIHADDADRLLARPVAIAFTPNEVDGVSSGRLIFLPLMISR